MDYMNEEEKKAIEDIEKTIAFYNKKTEKTISVTIDNFDVDILNIVLNLITKLQKENEEKDKQIDLMAEEISINFYNTCPYIDYNYDLDCQNRCIDNPKECWKLYFKKLAKEEGK